MKDTRRISLERQQNKLRGALGDAKRKGKEPVNRELLSRSAVRKVLLGAREEMPRSDRAAFFDWLERLNNKPETGVYANLSQDLTSSVFKSEAIGVASELEWIGYRLRPFLSRIAQFRAYVDELNEHFWRDDGNACQKLISEIESKFGISLWSINAEISIRQYFDGLESQKDYFSKVRAKYKAGVPAFIGFFLSVRNEQRSTFTLFNEDFARRLDDTKLNDDVKRYVKYKVLDEFEYTDDFLSAILRVEQGQSIVDIYETTIDLLQRSLSQNSTARWRDAAVALLRTWLGIPDFRISKLLFGFTGEIHTSELSLETSRRFEQAVVDDVWLAVWPLTAASDHDPDALDRNAPDLTSRSLALLNSVLWRDEQFEESRGRLLKFARNFGYLPSAKALGQLVHFLSLDDRNLPKALGLVVLNSRSLTPADVLYTDADLLERAVDVLAMHLPRNEVMAWAGLTMPEHAPSVQPMPWYVKALRAAGSDPLQAQDILDSLATPTLTEPQRILCANLQLQIQLAIGDLNESVALIAGEIARSPSITAIMPAQQAIGSRDWDALSRVPDKLDLAICLYAYWKQTDDSLHATFLRFAFEEVLAQLGAFLPSDIPSSTVAGNSKLLFFLSNVCIPVLMDTSGLFVSSEELLDERLKIISALSEIVPGGKEVYSEEASVIRANKLIKSGLAIVDSNRVNVDTSALSRWATKRYRESYLRYQALRQAGIGVSASFEHVIETLQTPSDASGEYFTIPDNEADTLLLELVLAIKNKFLEDPQYGLEYFLGKRIRHGTIAGHMRGPAETARLITERRGPGSPYERNSHWVDTISFKDALAQAEASAAFDHFSEEYDKLIAEVRDRYLHVKTGDHPDGLFDVVITTPQYHVLKSIILPDLDFDGFLLVCFNFFWGLLKPSLVRAANFLSVDTKARTIALYGELQAAINDAAATEEASRSVSVVIQNSSTFVQRELDTVASWFERIESQQGSHLFTLEELVEVSIRSVLKSLNTFRPDIRPIVSGDLKASATVLLVVWETVFVILDNVYQRAKVGNEPKIDLSCIFDRKESTLTLSVTNPVGDTVDIDNLRKKLDLTRTKIAAGDIVKGASADRGSGLLKVAALAREYRSGSFTFEMQDDRTFLTELRLPVYVTKESFSLSIPEGD